MLQDEERKEQISSAILNNQELKAELISRMRAEGNSFGMMKKHMMQVAKSDTATCKMMMGSDKLKGMIQKMNRQEQSSESSKAQGSSHMKMHLNEKHAKTNKDR